MKSTASLFILVFFYGHLWAQGSLLLVGGGAEIAGGWSDEPYAWAVQHTPNKKIAIISTDAGSDPDWLPDYFISLGALEVKNYVFADRASAGADGLLDQLTAYDMLFFKGGDQWLYYQYFKGTAVEEAMMQVFAKGGLVGGTSAGMAILGEYVYTAQKASLLTWEGLENIQSENLTLTNDFAPMLKGFITDTHFLERGRLPRLATMLAYYHIENGLQVNGVACDDQTALAIDKTNLAKAFGTGGTYIYRLAAAEKVMNQWSGTISARHLAYGMSIDLNTLALVDGPSVSSPGYQAENGNYELYLSGNNAIENDAAIVKQLSTLQGPVLIVTGQARLTAAKLMSALSDNGKSDVSIMSAVQENNSEDSWQWRNKIRLAKQLVFIENDFETLLDFMKNGPTGQLLYAHLRRDQITNAFFGEDSKLAGSRYVINNLEAPALAYQGGLTYAPGLGLLQNSIIIPGAFDPGADDYYENNTLSGLFALGDGGLSNAIYINKESWGHFHAQDGENQLSAMGKYALVLIENRSHHFQLFDQKTGANPRNNASYDSLVVQVLGHGSSISLGVPVPTNSPEYELESDPNDSVITGIGEPLNSTFISPTVTDSHFNLDIPKSGLLRVYNAIGTPVHTQHYQSGKHVLDLERPGMYLVAFMDDEASKLLNFQKIIKK